MVRISPSAMAVAVLGVLPSCALAFMPSPSTLTTPTSTTRQGCLTPMYATGSNDLSRRKMVQQGLQGLLFFLALTSAPRFATAVESSPNRALVTILRIDSLIKSLIKDLPTSEVIAPEIINAQIKYMARDLDMGNNVNLAVLSLPDSIREDARKHGREAYEYVSTIVEFAGFDKISQPGVSKYTTGIPSERLQFVISALTAADKELSSFLSAFDSNTLAQAKQVYKDIFPA